MNVCVFVVFAFVSVCSCVCTCVCGVGWWWGAGNLCGFVFVSMCEFMSFFVIVPIHVSAYVFVCMNAYVCVRVCLIFNCLCWCAF